MEDIISQGGRRPPGGWRRRLIVIAAVVLAAGLVVIGHLPHGRGVPAHAHRSGRPSRIVLPVISGQTAPVQVTARLPRTGARPNWFFPAEGRAERITGLPSYQFGYVFTRVEGGWAISPQPVGRGGCAYCPGSPWPVYYLANQARSVTPIARATMVAPGVTSGDLWLTTFPPNASLGTASGKAREFSSAGAPLGPAVRLPVGYGIYAATDRGLLLVPLVNYIPGTKAGTAQPLWDPVTRTTRRIFRCVLAASADDIVFTPRCGTASPVHLLNLTSGRGTVLALPRGSFAFAGVFSPDGRYLALRLQFGDVTARLELVTVRTGQLELVPGSWVSSEDLSAFGWPGTGDALAAELVKGTTAQVAFWSPGGYTPAVALVRPDQDPTDLVVG